jgi:hypothetical protein
MAIFAIPLETDTSNHAKDKWSSWKQTILFCNIFGHLSSIRQSMKYWTPVQVKNSLPLNDFLVIKSYLHSRHFLINVETEETELSSVNATLQKHYVKYLGLHFYRRITWHKHIFAKQKPLGITLTKMYWLLRRKLKLSRSNKLLIYKTILKLIWTYRI